MGKQLISMYNSVRLGQEKEDSGAEKWIANFYCNPQRYGTENQIRLQNDFAILA